MGKIAKLDPHVANLIAAGEVIERASSVIKELVENSIDAGSTSIVISLVDSGLKEMIVKDNGCGMDQMDARMCFEPHCTSKIKTEQDLFNINTLGFRGEALPSIVAVSNFNLKTSTEGGRGIMYTLKGGNLVTEAVISCNKGTEIAVRNLFFNTPARLQNLQSPNIELSYIVEYVQKEALAHSEVAFKLINNDRIIFQSFGTKNQLEVLTSIYGNEIGKDLRDIFNDNGYYRIKGYISKLSQTRSSKNHIHVIVNGRMIKSSNVIRAVINGYGTYLMTGRYPICLINITTDNTLVDVNVHPSKLEVRFSEEQALLQMITDTISDALSRTNMISDEQPIINDEDNKLDDNILDDNILDIEETDTNEDSDNENVVSNNNDSEINLNFQEENIFEEDGNIFTEDNDEEIENEVIETSNNNDYSETDLLSKLSSMQTTSQESQKIVLDDDDDFSFDDLEIEKKNFVEAPKQTEMVSKEPEQPVQEKFTQQTYDLIDEVHDDNNDSKLPKLTYLTQVFGTYLVCQDNDKLYLIDQHAANERVNYEKIIKELSKNNVISYELLVPIKVDFTISESLVINEKMNKIRELGIIMEEFGGGTYTVREIPVWLFKGREKEFVEEIVTQIISNEKSTKAQFLDSLAKSLACKKSIKANSYITQLEADYLLQDLAKCTNPYTCPHGRPIIVKFTKYEIEKWFKRVV